MWTVFIVLLPAAFLGVYAFGMRAAFVLILTTGGAVAIEALIQKGMKRPVTVKDGSAALTGLLLALNLLLLFLLTR